MTSHAFAFTVLPQETEIQLVGPAGPIPVEAWATAAPVGLRPGVDKARELEALDQAIAGDSSFLIEHGAIARLNAREAVALGLPPAARVVVALSTKGLLTQPDFTARLQWQHRDGQAIVGARRTGAWLSFGGKWHRLPSELYDLATAVDELNGAGADLASRAGPMQAFRELLPRAQADGLAQASGVLRTMTFVCADAFSLDMDDSGATPQLIPILHRAGDRADDPLLPPAQQDEFGRSQFHRFGEARGAYTLAGNVVVLLSPALRRGLQVVRRHGAASAATKRALFAAPRKFLAAELGDEADIVIEALFRDTKAYSDRVIGLGLWTPRVLPWIPLASNDWFGPPEDMPKRPPIGFTIGDRNVPLSAAQTEALREHVEAAIGRGVPSVSFDVDGETFSIPADQATLASLQRIENHHARQQSAAEPGVVATGDASAAQAVLAPIILNNEQQLDAEALHGPRRPSPDASQPRSLRTPPKAHQTAGISWLQRAWRSGLPGVLLADDMGLGKTLQGLAFLAWLREGMAAGIIPREPILIVAPTGLLQNWRAEHDRHLASPGLGTFVAAYGRSLASLRRADVDGHPRLDLAALRAADWVLTTYETLRDHAGDFAQVRFAALLLDEAQKIKTPGVRMTDAAKAVNAEFRIAMTGTPVENRLADLWCIVDAVYPGHLEDLKAFSARYERTPDPEALKQLKKLLDTDRGSFPAPLLRRLKEDELPDLPKHDIATIPREMPTAQAEACRTVIQAARRSEDRGAMLSALGELRRIALHPQPDIPDDSAFIAASARIQSTCAILDGIAERGERALIFLDSLAMQGRLAGLIQRRYSMTLPPMIISGSVSGTARQAHVDRFQTAPDGFDCMLLSPRAAGVGLTLTRANHVIHLSRWWNPAVEDQCNGRVLRIGQTRPVTIHLPIATYPDGRRSFDQNLHDLLERKRQLMRDTLMPPQEDETESELMDAVFGM